jgi:hypothetical protein
LVLAALQYLGHAFGDDNSCLWLWFFSPQLPRFMMMPMFLNTMIPPGKRLRACNVLRLFTKAAATCYQLLYTRGIFVGGAG